MKEGANCCSALVLLYSKFLENSPCKGMSELDYVQSNLVLDAAPVIEELLDASSLNTVLTMLEVINSAEELALLETLSLAQKRQVWDATPEATRIRLKQLRVGAQNGSFSGNSRSSAVSLNGSSAASTQFVDASDLLQDDALTQVEETAATELEVHPEEIDLMLQEPLNLSAQSTVAVGDWIVLQPKPKLSKAELIAIWEVIEVRGNYARIFAESLGTRIYPAAWMIIYPKPIDYTEPEF